MTNSSNSVHLQDFPDVNFIKDEGALVENIDLVRDVCSTALSIRDQKNLRVRLPLSKLSVIGKKSSQILDFKDIISDEVNVKNIEIQEEFDDLAELKLQINFKKIGKKYGPKIKEITAAARSGAFEQISKNEIKIADISLVGDEFELKLAPKNNDESSAIAALSDNSCLIVLDTKVTPELEQEGIARDIIRAVQQARKDADLDVSDRINLVISANNDKITVAAQNFADYIKEQVLALDLRLTSVEEDLEEAKFATETKIEDGDLGIGIF